MSVSSRDVFLFVPNLIGYARVLLALASLACFERAPLFLSCYVASFLLDAADGHAARLLHQTSKFGAVLDMATDRAGTAALVSILALLYPRAWAPAFLALSALDLGSHWLRMYASLLGGQGSHKAASPEHDGALVYVYYTNRAVLGGLCLMSELFYVALYAAHFYDQAWLRWVALGSFPFFFVKQAINVLQLLNSARDIVAYDVASKR